MRKRLLAAGMTMLLLLPAGGCAAGESGTAQNAGSRARAEVVEQERTGAEQTTERAGAEQTMEQAGVGQTTERTGMEAADWEVYFQGFRGTAVLYQPAENQYRYYNPDLWEYESSPCSTFKIISTLMGLEHGVIDPADSVRTWDQETYWNKNWNHDIGLEEAFKVSCIWYFRDVIDELGQETVQADLDRLKYGNRDISDWQGILNTNNNNMRLRGFWVESSLTISPRQQVETLARIFETDMFSAGAAAKLKAVMLTDNGTDDLRIYGKTGMGVKSGRCVDAWFVGFYEAAGSHDEAANPVYFAVRLDDPDNPDSSSQKAREIAVSIINATAEP